MIAYAQQSNILDFPPTATVQGKRRNHITFASTSNDWYTSSIYVEAAREVMQGIDLDPASCKSANRTVKASKYYSIEDNGLGHSWYGRIWLNPPYGTTNGKSNQGIWARRLIAEYEQGNVKQAVFLCNALTDTKWFHCLWAYPICFTHGRVNFYTTRMTTTVGNTHGSCFVYFGKNEQAFIDIFSQFGTIAKRVSTPRHTIATPSLWEVQ